MSHRTRSRRGLATWLADSTTPVFVLDARRQVLFFNHGCEQLTGWQAGDVIGQVCDYVSEPDPTQIECLTGALCPPADVLAGADESVPVFIITRGGQKLARITRYVPLATSTGAVDRILGIILPLPPHKPLTAAPDRQLHAELAALRTDLRKRYDVTSLVGRSAAFRRLMSQIDLSRHARASIHLVGEAGTGREHMARLIHYQGPTPLQAFVPLDCARLTGDELMSTFDRLLADVAGSELPHLRPGVVYFRNVDCLPADMQRRLVELWGTPELALPLRLMSDSTQTLERAAAADRLRPDCLQLLTSLIIPVPPLRERRDDLPLIAQDMLERHNRDRESQVCGFSEPVWDAFRKYNWPGNLDELQVVIREAYEACSGKLVTPGDLPFRFRTGLAGQQVPPSARREMTSLQERLETVEREHILLALEMAGQNKSQAAHWLGITRPKLYRRMQQLGLDGGVVDAESV